MNSSALLLARAATRAAAFYAARGREQQVRELARVLALEWIFLIGKG